MIVNTGKELVRDLIFDQATGLDIDTMLAGDDDGTILALNATNTVLGNQQFSKAATESKTGQKIVTKKMTMLTSEGNGVTYEEVGVATGISPPTDALFNRILHNAIAKTSSIEIRYEIEIEVK